MREQKPGLCLYAGTQDAASLAQAGLPRSRTSASALCFRKAKPSLEAPAAPDSQVYLSQTTLVCYPPSCTGWGTGLGTAAHHNERCGAC